MRITRKQLRILIKENMDQERVIEIENALKDLFPMRDHIVEKMHNLGKPQSYKNYGDHHTFIPQSEIQRSQILSNLKRKLRSVNLEIHAKVLKLYELTNRRVYQGRRKHPLLDRLDYRHYSVFNPNSMSDDDLYSHGRRRLYEEAFNDPFM